MSSGKTYGLSVPKKNIQTTVKHAAFIDTESDNSDGGGTTDWVKKSLQKCSQKSAVKKQTKIDMQRAIEQDSTVYQYDEIYDQLELKKNESTVSTKDKDRKPKYIQQLMQTADRRKRENERRIERQVQKEREAEGEQFKDKETFVTSAYKKKLEEFAALEEEEKRQNLLEEIGDVTKQQDISGFYRHLYQTTVNTDEKKKDYTKNSKSLTEGIKNSRHLESKTKGTPERQKSKPTSEQSKTSKSTPEHKGTKNTPEQSKSKIVPETNSSSKGMSESIRLDEKKSETKEARQYRKRKQSESSEGSNKDADTSVSSSSSSSESDDAKSDHGPDLKRKRKMTKDSSKRSDPRDETNDGKNTLKKSIDTKTVETKSSKPVPDKPSSGENISVKPVKKPVPDLSIWEKRTVGTVFDEALKRFLERRAGKQSKSG